MGQISEILGKRSAAVTGEMMVEVGSTKQSLKTHFADREATHAEAGGEIHRDEVPLMFQPFVERYFEEIRKTPPSRSRQNQIGRRMHADYLAQLLHQPQLSAGWLLAGIAVAFWLGAMHALEPGHGKTIVAAYLVGSRGNMKHAALLGATVTFTHTISVFLLGIGTLLLSSYIVPEKIIPVLGVDLRRVHRADRGLAVLPTLASVSSSSRLTLAVTTTIIITITTIIIMNHHDHDQTWPQPRS